jgi:hypothetical protein
MEGGWKIEGREEEENETPRHKDTKKRSQLLLSWLLTTDSREA